MVTVEGGETDWPALARIVSEFGRKRELKVFDTSANIPNYIRTLEVSVCSSDGLFLMIDKRTYSDQSMNRDGNRIRAVLRTYKNACLVGWASALTARPFTVMSARIGGAGISMSHMP